MTPFPLGLDSPGKRLTSTRENRDPARLYAIIAEHHFRGFARYARRDVTGDGQPETFCNLFAQDVAEAMSVLLPRNTRANQIIAWLEEQAAEPSITGWEHVDEHTAQAMADQGQLVLVGWVNPTGGPGHIAVVVPSLAGHQFGTPESDDVFIAQAGTTNFTRGLLESGFGSRAVSFFGHP